jgi:hypothetical protein
VRADMKIDSKRQLDARRARTTAVRAWTPSIRAVTLEQQHTSTLSASLLSASAPRCCRPCACRPLAA